MNRAQTLYRHCGCKCPLSLATSKHSDHWNVRSDFVINMLIINCLEWHSIDPTPSINSQPGIAWSLDSSIVNMGVSIAGQHTLIFMETCSPGGCVILPDENDFSTASLFSKIRASTWLIGVFRTRIKRQQCSAIRPRCCESRKPRDPNLWFYVFLEIDSPPRSLASREISWYHTNVSRGSDLDDGYLKG